MPVYEYRCTSCDTEFEALRSMAEADKATACLHCGANSQKLPSVFAATAGPAKIGVPKGKALRKKQKTMQA